MSWPPGYQNSGYPPTYAPQHSTTHVTIPPNGWPPGYQNSGPTQSPPGYSQKAPQPVETKPNPFDLAAQHYPSYSQPNNTLHAGSPYLHSGLPSQQYYNSPNLHYSPQSHGYYPQPVAQITPNAPVIVHKTTLHAPPQPQQHTTPTHYIHESPPVLPHSQHPPRPQPQLNAQIVSGLVQHTQNGNALKMPKPQPPAQKSSAEQKTIAGPSDRESSRDSKALVVAHEPKKRTEPALPFFIHCYENYFVMLDTRKDSMPLVLEKSAGRPANFIPYLPSHMERNADITYRAEFILGIIGIENVSYLILVTAKTAVAKVRTEPIYKIKDVAFVPFSKSSTWVRPPSCALFFERSLVYLVARFLSMEEEPSVPDEKPPYYEVYKFITSGLFYFSFGFHLTRSIQTQENMKEEFASKPLWKCADRRFFWNYYIARHFIKQSAHAFIVPVIRGFAGDACDQYLSSAVQVDIILISRISCLRAGTRYNARGINDDGNVANFVETEQIIICNDNMTAFLQIRGSVPLFWEQNQKSGSHRWLVEFSRSPEASALAFKKHFDDLLGFYQKTAIINLLESKKKEGELATAYANQLATYLKNAPANAKSLNYFHWDFHAVCGNSHYENVRLSFIPAILSDLDDFKFFHLSPDGPKSYQNGTFRVNCLDCLDRTNVILGEISKQNLPAQLHAMGIADTYIPDTSGVGSVLKHLWADSGDNISRAYAGTDAMKSSFTRTGKRTIRGMVDDAAKSVERAYHQKYKDDEKQWAIDQFLGNIEDDAADEVPLQGRDLWVATQLTLRQHLYMSKIKTRIYLGTWNVGARISDPQVSLDPWICPEYPSLRELDHDAIPIYVFAIQEIVDLNPSSIYKADEKNLQYWCQNLRDQINKKRRSTNKVVFANSVQLVGMAVIIFVQETQLPYVTNFVVEKCKVAMSGLAGNKGALAARFDYHNTSICCVCCHLTAGHSKVNERIKDIIDIQNNTEFSGIHHAKKITNHMYQFWLGDMNFRIDLPYNEVIAKIKAGDLAYIANFDQLLKARTSGHAFKGFHEGPLSFIPTYKYDVGSDVWDTSDKKRVPAWCDRIMWGNEPTARIDLLSYSRGEGLYISDHRPVKALFSLDITKNATDKRDKIKRELLKISATLDPEIIHDYSNPYQITPLPIPFEQEAGPPPIPPSLPPHNRSSFHSDAPPLPPADHLPPIIPPRPASGVHPVTPEPTRLPPNLSTPFKPMNSQENDKRLTSPQENSSSLAPPEIPPRTPQTSQPAVPQRNSALLPTRPDHTAPPSRLSSRLSTSMASAPPVPERKSISPRDNSTSVLNPPEIPQRTSQIIEPPPRGSSSLLGATPEAPPRTEVPEIKAYVETLVSTRDHISKSFLNTANLTEATNSARQIIQSIITTLSSVQSNQSATSLSSQLLNQLDQLEVTSTKSIQTPDDGQAHLNLVLLVTQIISQINSNLPYI